MRTITLLAAMWFALLAATAQPSHPTRLGNSLSYIPADSVMLFSLGSNWRTMALLADTTARPVAIEPFGKDQFDGQAAAWEACVRDSLNLVGGTGDELADPQTRPALRMLDLSARLFLSTGDARYVETYERALFNAVTAGALARPITDGTREAATALMTAPSLVYATGDDGIFVNLFANCYARFDTPVFQGSIDQVTDMPTTGDVVLRLRPRHNGYQATLWVRLPRWAEGRIVPEERYVADEEMPLPTVYVNGKELLSSETARGYLVIRRKWNSGDEVRISFPLPVTSVRRAENGQATGNTVALTRGPLTYVGLPASPGSALSTAHWPDIDFDRAQAEFIPLVGHFYPVTGNGDASDTPGAEFFAVPYAYASPAAMPLLTAWWPVDD